jgi:F-type H+-transporting ATPase subunit epsilon
MSEKQLQLKILSPSRILYRGEAASVGIPGELGYMTLLPGHASMVAALDIGALDLIKQGETSEKLFIAGGFVDIANDGVTILADVVEKSSEINIDRAKKALSRADERLAGRLRATDEKTDLVRALAAKKRAQYRLELAGAAKSAH